MSQKFCALNDNIPREFHRGAESFDFVTNFKAIQFHLILQFMGPVICNDVLTTDELRHFNLLHRATRILSDPYYCFEKNDLAKEILINFHEQTKTVLNKSFLTFNFHNVIHLHEEVQRHGPLYDFANYCFESYLHHVKLLLRKPGSILGQIHRRLSEKSRCKDFVKIKSHKDGFFLGETVENDRNLPNGFKEVKAYIKFPTFALYSDSLKDGFCYLQDKTVVYIEKICLTVDDSIPVILGKKFLTMQSLPYYPIDSRSIDVFRGSNFSQQMFWPVAFIDRKTFALPSDKSSYYIFPFLGMPS